MKVSMKKTLKRVGALAAGILLLAGPCATVSAETGYTYNYDYWGDVQYSPDAYRVVGVYTAVEMGLEMGTLFGGTSYVQQPDCGAAPDRRRKTGSEQDY